MDKQMDNVVDIVDNIVDIGGLSLGRSGSTVFLERSNCIWGFPKIRGTFLGVPIIGTVVF